MAMSPNEQVERWLETATPKQLKDLVTKLYGVSVESSVLIYQYVANGGHFTGH